jgi:hypothetical protein
MVSRPAHTSTAASALGFVSATPNLVETARVMIFGTATPTPTPKPVSRAGKSGSGFPWWLLLAGGAAAYAATKRKQIAQGLSDYRMKIRARKQAELEAQWAREAAARKQAQARTAALDAKIERMEAKEERRWQPVRTPARPAFDMAKWKQRDYAESARWEQQQAYQRYRQGEWADPQPQKSLWQKAGDWLQQKVVQPVQQAVPKVMNWVDQHQREIAIGIGIAAGVAAVVLSGGAATPLVAAAWVAGSAVVAGGVAAAGTVGLNAYFHRPLGTNVLQNLGYAAGAAAVTATAGFALGSLASAATKATASFCASHLAVCTTVSPVFKAVDQGWTAYDVWQSERVLKDRRASPQQKLLAAANIGLAAWSEGLEPDELLPVGLPLDDVARREVLAKFRKVLETEGEEAALRYLRGAAGKNAPQVIRAMYDQGLLREVRSAGEWEKIFERGVRQGAGLDVHHLIERRFAERLGLRESEIPAVVLDRTFHQQEVTARLFSRLPTNRANFEPQEIWNVYKDVYGAHEDWLEAIWPYFARLGVQR